MKQRDCLSWPSLGSLCLWKLQSLVRSGSLQRPVPRDSWKMSLTTTHIHRPLTKCWIPHTVSYKTRLMYAGQHASEGVLVYRWGIGGQGRVPDLLRSMQLLSDEAGVCIQLDQVRALYSREPVNAELLRLSYIQLTVKNSTKLICS